MTCRDCLHWDACKNMLEAMGHIVDGDGQNADKRCSDFADKSRFVELPTPRLPLVLSDDLTDTDVYCPNCGGDLSGGWPDGEPDCEWPLYQCFYCGQSIDETKVVSSREAAKAAIKEKEKEK